DQELGGGVCVCVHHVCGVGGAVDVVHAGERGEDFVNTLDYVVLFGAVLAIAIYGVVRTRGKRNLHDYLRGKKNSWFFIGLSVMATQASAVTFLSTPGQGYASGMGFVQNYFALPLALVIIAAMFLPIYRRFNVYTAY